VSAVPGDEHFTFSPDSTENRVHRRLQGRDTAAVAEGCIALLVDAADRAVALPDIVERNPGRGKRRGGDPEGQTGYVGPCRSGLHAVFRQPPDAGLVNPGGHRHEGAVPIVNPIRWQLIENRAMLLLDV
jgi:hypothetical protein